MGNRLILNGINLADDFTRSDKIEIVTKARPTAGLFAARFPAFLGYFSVTH
jgi:hypothetical protein